LAGMALGSVGENRNDCATDCANLLAFCHSS
jgi:hypothetical protein